jgi:hypothetical protein
MPTLALWSLLAHLESTLEAYDEAERRFRRLSPEERAVLEAMPAEAYPAQIIGGLVSVSPKARRGRTETLRAGLEAIHGVADHGRLLRHELDDDALATSDDRRRRLVLIAKTARLIESMGERSVTALERFLEAVAEGRRVRVVAESTERPWGWPEVRLADDQPVEPAAG